MKIKELIVLLSQQDPDHEVLVPYTFYVNCFSKIKIGKQIKIKSISGTDAGGTPYTCYELKGGPMPHQTCKEENVVILY